MKSFAWNLHTYCKLTVLPLINNCKLHARVSCALFPESRQLFIAVYIPLGEQESIHRETNSKRSYFHLGRFSAP